MSNKKISIIIRGGLGNILFQIATACSISIRDSMSFCIDASHYHGGHFNLEKYYKNFFRKLNFCNNFKEDFFFGESQHEFREIPKFESNTKLTGYFQSEKYFVQHRKEILELFSPPDEILIKLNSEFGNLLSEETCGIHIRRGDYIHLYEFYFNLGIDYFKSAVSEIGEEKTFLIFSDDIDWCKNNFNFVKNKIFIENLDDFESIYLMSICKDNIISNSTFGWWGAWLNQNENKKVVCSEKWFGDSLKHLLNSKDINCENWIKL
jgi:hypothetical protein